MTSLGSQAVGRFGPTGLFVLLWSGGALVGKVGVADASPVVLLVLRFALALAVVSVLALRAGPWWPAPSRRGPVAACGAVLVGGYSLCYFAALAHQVSPGVLCTVLGVQPILTLVLLDRRVTPARLGGLVLALAGLVAVVLDGIVVSGLGWLGMGFALGALACVTAGTAMQKRLALAPLEVLPLQYAVALAMCLVCLPLQPLRLDATPALWASVLWLGLVISVAATLLLYRLIARGNLVNVTSLFYLVPAVTAVLDALLFGHAMALGAWCGLAAILAGVWLVHRPPAGG